MEEGEAAAEQVERLGVLGVGSQPSKALPEARPEAVAGSWEKEQLVAGVLESKVPFKRFFCGDVGKGDRMWARHKK